MLESSQADADKDSYVWILGLTEDGDDRMRAIRPNDARVGRGRVPAARLQENIQTFVNAMGHAIQDVPEQLSGFGIDTIAISAEVSVTGTVSLLGSGGEVAAKGGITFTLTRSRTRS